MLRSFVELHLAANAVLQASTNTDHFPERTDIKHMDTAFLPRASNASILFAEEAEGIAITGQGVIDCGGEAIVVRHAENVVFHNTSFTAED